MINTTHPDIIVPKHHLQALLYDKTKSKRLPARSLLGMLKHIST